MPIVAKHVIEARIAAREAQQLAQEQARSEAAAPAPATEPMPVAEEQVTASMKPEKEVKAKAKPKPKTKASRPKKQPTGDYEHGYCRAPVKNQFDGSKPGPGRPRGALSQDTLLRKHLSEAHTVARNGKQTKAQTRELMLMLKVKAAISGDRRAQDYLLAEASRLFAERRDAAGGAPHEPLDMDEHDQAMLEALRDTLFPGTGQDNEPDEDASNQEPKRKGDRS